MRHEWQCVTDRMPLRASERSHVKIHFVYLSITFSNQYWEEIQGDSGRIMAHQSFRLIAILLANAFCSGMAVAESAIFTSQADFVSFESGGSEIGGGAQDQLDALVAVMNSPHMLDVCMRLVGHSDSTGKETGNLRVSRLRAERVAAYLSTRLLRPGRILQVSGVGSSDPMPEYPDYAREQRRVTFQVRKCLPSDLISG